MVPIWLLTNWNVFICCGLSSNCTDQPSRKHILHGSRLKSVRAVLWKWKMDQMSIYLIRWIIGTGTGLPPHPPHPPPFAPSTYPLNDFGAKYSNEFAYNWTQYRCHEATAGFRPSLSIVLRRMQPSIRLPSACNDRSSSGMIWSLSVSKYETGVMHAPPSVFAPSPLSVDSSSAEPQRLLFVPIDIDGSLASSRESSKRCRGSYTWHTLLS